jgi:hypothetical protein
MVTLLSRTAPQIAAAALNRARRCAPRLALPSLPGAGRICGAAELKPSPGPSLLTMVRVAPARACGAAGLCSISAP